MNINFYKFRSCSKIREKNGKRTHAVKSMRLDKPGIDCNMS